MKEESLFSPFRTAVVATVLAGALSGVAQAHVAPSPISASQIAVAALAVSDAAAAPSERSTISLQQTASSASPSQADEFRIPASVRRQLVSLEAAGNMPSANADMQMWGGGDTLKDAKRTAQISRFARGIISRTSSIAMSLTRSAMRFIGTPYVFGGTSPSGFDCSGYTQHVFAMLGISIPRTADAQYYAASKITGNMRAGDLVFFQTYAPGPSHVGIYMGNGKFINSQSHGVMISSLHDSYWAARYIGAKRVAALK